MADRERRPYGGGDPGYTEDMTEETLGVQEQERQERQHRQEQQRGRQTENDSPYADQDDLEDLQ